MTMMSRKLAALLLALAVALSGVSALAETAEEAAPAEVTEETGAAEATEETAAETTEETAEAAAAAEPVLLATVNGEEIKSDNQPLQQLVSYYTQYYTAYGYDMTDESMRNYLMGAGMEWAIEDALYRQKAGELGVAVMTDAQKAEMEAEAKAEWDSVVDRFVQEQGLAEDATDEQKSEARISALATIESEYGYTEESYIAEYVESSKESMLRENVQKALLGETEVTEEEITDRFNELVEEDRTNYEGNIPMYEYYTRYMGNNSYYVPEGYRGITHILLDVDDDLLNSYTSLAAQLEEQEEKATADEAVETGAAEQTDAAETAAPAEGETEQAEPVTQEMVDAAKQAILDSVQAQVDEIMAKYADGTPFADLIAEYGTDPGMTVEPNKTDGYAVHQESILVDPAFIEGAMSLNKVGDISEPVLGSYGVHILHYTRDIPAGAVELTESIREELRAELQQEKETEAVGTMIEDWREASEITYTEAGEAYRNALTVQESDESVTATEATEEALAGDE